ncbi:GntR family transcriptional regulator [Aeromicrobium sp. 50.2.37]|uniref:GntR family transcriptional regulator n=1 Tax=Aeromicrobium sp. 50.2.37 TaxID=2969305 RepID=UPI0021501D08|nr:GntR family transcriptional regulator [Aeromicrobium sp. 50.2.37]MCR4512677.1 GntR family transcriptional regulator [Aeromicrobium sp. 50.2.37]
MTTSTNGTVRAGGGRLSVAVLDVLKERLLDGDYPSGSRISIEEVKTEFGVSKQPVMEAMRRLEAIGIVQIVPQSGCRVAEYSAREVRDFFKLFGRFEGEIAAAAAARRTDQQLSDLDAAWDAIAELHDESDAEQRSRDYRFRNREFHLAIHSMAHSRIMAELSERMWDMSDFFISTVGGKRAIGDAVDHRNHDHDVIRGAIRTGNAEVARVAMQSHIEETVAIFGADDGHGGA